MSKLAAILLGELVAIMITLRFLKTELTKHIFTVIKIFSRSQSAVGLLTLGWEVKTYKQTIADTKNLISYFTNKHIQVQIERTPGHANIHGNDIADRLAKEAANEAEDMTETDTVTPMTDIRKAARDSCMKKWQRKWETAETGRHLYKFRPDVNTKDINLKHCKFQTVLRQLCAEYQS